MQQIQLLTNQVQQANKQAQEATKEATTAKKEVADAQKGMAIAQVSPLYLRFRKNHFAMRPLVFLTLFQCVASPREDFLLFHVSSYSGCLRAVCDCVSVGV